MTEYFSKKCAICGKEIITHGADCWAYKIRLPNGRMIYFCSYKHKRQYEKDHPETQKQLPALRVLKERKEPQSRMKTAEVLVEEIRNGRNPVDYLKKAGYGNPYEAYNAVRHHCEIKAPEMLEVLKPIRELNKKRTKQEDSVLVTRQKLNKTNNRRVLWLPRLLGKYTRRMT